MENEPRADEGARADEPRADEGARADEPRADEGARADEPRADEGARADEEEGGGTYSNALIRAPISPGSVRGVLVEGFQNQEGHHQTLISFVGVDEKKFWPIVCCWPCKRDDPPWFKVSKSKLMLWARLSFVIVFITYNIYQMIEGETKIADGILNVFIAIFLFFTQSSFSGIIKAHTYRRVS